MIKINLLESVTDKQASAVVVVEKKVASPTSRLLLMALVVTVLTITVVAWDIVSTQMQKADAERQLDEQKKIAAELEEVMKEQKDLEQKIANIDARINAIKALRASQSGPSSVLEAVRERIGMVPGLYLESIEQKGDQLTIKGNSPDEAAVTQFGRSLEFSSGLFSNLNIETQRKEIQSNQVASPAGMPTGAAETPKLETVNFTIRTSYTANGKPNADQQPVQANANTPAGQTPNAQTPNAPSPANPQVAKNQDK
ncbi:MAG TPA: PilN domain-containing protein [Pyrinomonadaceae bacterium]|nr:PilN domain-containing protein [Pyrinomonadaceae bacterium]